MKLNGAICFQQQDLGAPFLAMDQLINIRSFIPVSPIIEKKMSLFYPFSLEKNIIEFQLSRQYFDLTKKTASARRRLSFHLSYKNYNSMVWSTSWPNLVL